MRCMMLRAIFARVPMDWFDQHVLPQLLHQMSKVANPGFKDQLMDCLEKLSADDSLEGKGLHSSTFQLNLTRFRHNIHP